MNRKGTKDTKRLATTASRASLRAIPFFLCSLAADAFGSVTSETNAAVDHLFGMTGRDFDEITDLRYHRARWFDPRLGQWLSEDPIGFSAGDENLRRYVGNGTTNATDPSGLEEDPAVTQMRAQLAAGNYAEYARLQERRFGATVQESPRNSRKFKVARLSSKILVAPRPPASPVPPPISDLPPGLPPLSHEVIIVLEYSPSRDRTQEHLDEMAKGPWYTLTGIGSKLFGWTGMGRALELDAEANLRAYENLFYLGELKAGANRQFSEGAISGITFVASIPPMLIQIGVPGPEDIYLAPVFKYLGKTGMKITREAGEFVLRHQKTGELARGAVVIMRKLKDAIPTRMLDDLFRRFRGNCDAPRGGAISGVFPGARRVGGFDSTMLGQTRMNCGPSCVGVVLQRRGGDISRLNLGRFTSSTGTNKRHLVKLLRDGGVSDSSIVLRHRMTLPRLLDDLGEGRQLIMLIDNGVGGGHWVLVERVVERGGQQYIRLFDPSKTGFGRWDVPLKMFESRLRAFGGQGVSILP